MSAGPSSSGASSRRTSVSGAGEPSNEPPAGPLVSEDRLSVLYWAAVNVLTNEEYAAGLAEDEYLRRAAKVTKLELFMHTLPDVETLADFPNLVELALHLESVPRALGLANTKSLQRLCITECGLQAMAGIEHCTQLTHLDLSQNVLTEMDGAVLRCLGRLRTLWLCENKLSRVSGLEALPQLSCLWLGKNRIASLCDALNGNAALEELNVSGNLIANFKDIPNLARMKRLNTLSFGEPHFGENPLCSLCNYSTYVLFHMPQLRAFDSQIITDDLRQLAEATYMKKKMYYNMRIKTLKRNTSNVIRKAMEARQTKVSQINLNLNVLLRQTKDVEREIHEQLISLGDATVRLSAATNTGTAGAAAETLELLHRKHKVLQAGVVSKTSEIEAVEARAAALKRTVCETSQTSICRLMVELETGGNIRLEDGKPSDVWYSSCVDLVSSRFQASDYAEHAIGGLKVTRVTRIHNRYLRNRFEARLDEMVNTSDGSYKRSLEYLFFADPAEMPGELVRTMEEGFRPVEAYLGPCGHAAVPLSNSVALCDLPRLRAEHEKLTEEEKAAMASGSADARHAPLLSTQLLITKVFLSRCAQEKSSLASSKGRSGADGKHGGGSGGAQPPPVRREDYSGFASVYRAAGTDPKQRRWFVFEPALVLPEYLVEIEYYPSKRPPEREPSAAQLAELGGGLTSGGVTSDAEAIDLANLTRPLLRFVQQCALASAADPYDEACTAALNMPPPLPQRPKLDRITSEAVSSQAHGSELKDVEVLNLHGNAIRRIEGLGYLSSLRVLVLCFNEIARVEGLEALRCLERLELGFNLIKRIEGLKGLGALTHLELNNNLIYRLDDVSVLAKHVPKLETLTLRNNAVCEVKAYRQQLLLQLSNLTTLDGIPVESRERQPENGFDAAAATITPELIRMHAYSRKRYSYSLRPNSIAEGDGAEALEALDAPGGGGGGGGGGGSSGSSSGLARSAGADGEGWWALVEELELNHQHLRKLHGLEKLVNLRRASFCNNELTRVEGLERCVELEELSLEDNRIMKLENLSCLRRLTKLDLGKNKITHVEGLEPLSVLSQLSLEDNDICTLGPLGKILSLMELYIGNNRLTSLKEVQQLKTLPKLIILDLSGNTLCDADDYRAYSVYQLRKLKVLDGVGIESNEQMSARERYAGRLTPDVLIERLGHSFWQHVRELDLARSKLRELDVLHSDGFCNLRELNLDGNLIPDVHALPRLPSLTVLRLNNNLVTSSPPPLEPPLASGSRPIGLHTLTALEVLQLGYNQISDLPGLRLSSLHSLRVLHLQGNELQRVDGLSSLHQLRELVLDRNKIKQLDASSLSNLTSLRELRMEEVGLRSLVNLAPLPVLQSLFLGSNRVVELTELDRLAHLPALVSLVLANNPLARKPLYRPTALRKLATVRTLDGREVGPDERERAELLLASERSGAPIVHESRVPGNKVPLKLTSMSFELMAGLPLEGAPSGDARQSAHGPQGLGAGLGPQAPLSAGERLMGVSAMAVPTQRGSNAADGPGWHPLSGGHDSFFLPSTGGGKQALLPRHAERRQTGNRGAQWRVLEPHGR